jgi:integrase
MASATRIGGAWKIRFYDGAGNRRQIHLTGANQRTAENIARHVGILNTAKILNAADIDRGTALWLQGIGKNLFSKLAAVGLVEARRTFTVREWVRRYIENRTDLKDRTRVIMRQAEGSLASKLGDRPIQAVSESDAVAFKAWLRTPAGGDLAENTARRRCGHARQFFTAAVREGLITRNPFAAVSVQVGTAEAKHRFINAEECRRILEACPCQDWRTLFALARWGGLRFPSEVLKLSWRDIDWAEGRMNVPEPKVEHHAGRGRRTVPLFPELRQVLAEAFEAAPEGTEFVVNRYRDRGANARTTFAKILDRAGVPRFERPFCNLRSSRVTELRQRFDPKVVAVWMGHSESVSAKHYTQVRPEDFAAAVGRTTDPQTDPKASENPGTRGTVKTMNPENACVFPGSAVEFAGIRRGEMLRQGFEPTPENTGKSGNSESHGPTDGPKPQPADVAALAAVLAALPPDRLAAVLLELVQSQAGR